MTTPLTKLIAENKERPMSKCGCMQGAMMCFVPCEIMMEAERQQQEIYVPSRGVFVTKVNIDGKVKYREGIIDEAHNG